MKTFRRVRLTGELTRHAHEGFALARQFRRHGPRHLAPDATRTALMIAAEAGRQADLAIAAPDATPRAPERAKGSAITPPESEAKAMPPRSTVRNLFRRGLGGGTEKDRPPLRRGKKPKVPC